MSNPILPYDVWPSGIEQASVPANQNALRTQILFSEALSDTESNQPADPADGAVYIIPIGATGAAWSTFSPDDLAIFRDGAWYAFSPVVGVRMTVLGAQKIYAGTAGWVAFGGSGEWGSITGILSSQLDLQAALDSKVDVASNFLPVNTITASGTLAISNAGQFITCDHASVAIDIEVPPQSSVSWANFTEIHFIRTNAAAVSFSPGAGVSITCPASQALGIKEVGGVVTLKQIAEDSWVAFGALDDAP